MDNNTIKVFAPAKINLYLHITGKRPNGYHELESLVVFSKNFGDEIEIKQNNSNKINLEIKGEYGSALSVSNNLVIKAVEVLKPYRSNNFGVDIVLNKQIPIMAGLGGGSSDAAAVLKGLNRLWNLELSTNKLCEIGIKIGADVPSCIHANALFMEGIGEKIKPANLKVQLYGILVNAGINLETKKVFGFYNASFSKASKLLEISGDVIEWLGNKQNDLTKPALMVSAELLNIYEAVAKTSGVKIVRMSGSGSSFFGVYSSLADAQDASLELEKNHKNWFIKPVEFM